MTESYSNPLEERRDALLAQLVEFRRMVLLTDLNLSVVQKEHDWLYDQLQSVKTLAALKVLEETFEYMKIIINDRLT
jgi:hypothetical protein